MVVPHGEPLYYQERPRIAIPAHHVVDLGRQFGLHPASHRSRLCGQEDPGADSRRRRSDVMRNHMAPRIAWTAGSSAAARRLRVAARNRPLIKQERRPRSPSHAGGWDTHFNQGRAMADSPRGSGAGLGLASFARTWASACAACGAHDVRVRPHDRRERQQRTDHGHATAMLALGGPVNAARARPLAGLEPATRFEGGDVAVTTDFRRTCSAKIAVRLAALLSGAAIGARRAWRELPRAASPGWRPETSGIRVKPDTWPCLQRRMPGEDFAEHVAESVVTATSRPSKRLPVRGPPAAEHRAAVHRPPQREHRRSRGRSVVGRCCRSRRSCGRTRHREHHHVRMRSPSLGEAGEPEASSLSRAASRPSLDPWLKCVSQPPMHVRATAGAAPVLMSRAISRSDAKATAPLRSSQRSRRSWRPCGCASRRERRRRESAPGSSCPTEP